MLVRPLAALSLILLAAGAAAERPEPISVEALFSNPVFSSPRFSPDGKKVALLHSKGDDQFLLVRDAAGGKLRPIAKLTDPAYRFRWLEWANGERLLLSAETRNLASVGMRSRSTRLFGIDADGSDFDWLGKRWPLHGQEELQAFLQDGVVHLLPHDPEHVLMQYRDPYSRYRSIRAMNVRTGALTMRQVAKRPIFEWFVDAAGGVRAGRGGEDQESFLWVRRSVEEDFVEIGRHRAIEEEGLRLLGFSSSDPDRIFVGRSTEGRVAVHQMSISTGEIGRRLFSHPEVDAGSLAFDRSRERLLGVRFIGDRARIEPLDEEFGRIHRAVRRAFGDEDVEIFWIDVTTDAAVWLAWVGGPTRPPMYYTFDRARRRLEPLTEPWPDVPDDRLSPTRRIDYEATDGLSIRAYLTLPTGHGSSGLPLVVVLHGGPKGFPWADPWSREWIRWDPVVQLLASRGFAVLQVNYRGSQGFGRVFAHAGRREWGRRIQDDVTDGVRHLIDRGVADPDRVGIFGEGFGGHVALFGLVKTPHQYRAGASLGGVSDLETLVGDDQWYEFRHEWHGALVGEGRDDREFLRNHSPLRRVAEVQVPVLLGHGADDSRVHPRHSRDMARALRAAGAVVDHLEFENETDRLLLESNRIRFYTRLAAFFEEHLAPRSGVP